MVDREKFVSSYLEVMSIPAKPLAWWEAKTLEERMEFAGKVYDGLMDTSPVGEAALLGAVGEVCDHVVVGGEG